MSPYTVKLVFLGLMALKKNSFWQVNRVFSKFAKKWTKKMDMLSERFISKYLKPEEKRLKSISFNVCNRRLSVQAFAGPLACLDVLSIFGGYGSGCVLLKYFIVE